MTRAEADAKLRVGAIGLFLLGLLSKTAIVTLPLAWLVIFWWKRGAISWRRDVVPLIPFFFLSAAAGLMTRWVEYGNIGYKARILDLSLLDRCLIAGRAFWFQLGKLLWPSNLMFVYPRWEINAASGGSISFPSLSWDCWEFYGVCGDGPELHWRECSSIFSCCCLRWVFSTFISSSIRL